MKWQDLEISCGFGGGEETQKFGPRQEIGSSLYQVDTVASISNQSQDAGSPWILSTGCMDRIAVIIERHALLFEDCCSNHLCSFKADLPIDTISWSEDGSFFVFTDRSGTISLAHLETEEILFSKNLASNHNGEKEQCFASVMFAKVLDDTYNLIVITSGGQGFRITGVDLTNLNKAILEKDVTQANEIKMGIQYSMFSLHDCHSQINSVTLACDEMGELSLLVVGDGDCSLSEWSLEEDEVTLIDFCQHVVPDAGFKKCLESPDGLYLIVLDDMNQISLWSRRSFYLIESWSESEVDNFILFLTSSVETDSSKISQSKDDLKIVLLTKEKDEKRDLIVLGLPNFEHVYTLKVSASAALASLPIQQEIIMFLVGEEDTDSVGDMNVGTVHVKCLMEAIPQNRFSRLLHSKKFAEAENFAKTFNLDVQMVHQVKSSYILDQLSPWGSNFPTSSTEKFEELMTELKACLDKIEDMERIVNCCLRAQLPSLSATYDLLNYAREKVNFETRKFTKSSNLFQELLDGANRLVTFETAFGATHFSGAAWSLFLSSSLIDEVIKCFDSRNINSGIIVWRRHQSEFKSEFKLDQLKKILNSIPESTPSTKIIPWLREDFVPYVLTVLPEGQCILADWLEKAARRLETSVKEKENWPDNALEMAEVMYTAFSSVTQSTQERDVATPMQFATKVCKLSISYFDNTSEEDGPEHGTAMKKLGNLVKSLREVKSLHHEYNCKLSLGQFTSEDTRSITFHLLDRIAAAELIPQTVKKYVKPYILKNNLKIDDLLYEYIVIVVDSRSHVACMWELKVIAIIKEIQRKEQRCEATLKLMLKAKTPWSVEVETLIATEMKASPDNERLERQFQFAKLRKMMDGYGIRDTNLADISKIQAVIRFMFSTDNSNSLEDALQISKHFPKILTKGYIYFERIKYWIENDQTTEACELLKHISKTDLIKASHYILTWVISVISWPVLDDKDMAEQIRITRAAILVSNNASKLDENIKREISNTCAILMNINRLQTEFGVFISHKEYLDETYRKNAVQLFLKDPSKYEPKLVYSANKKTSKTCSPESRIKRFSELLGFDDTSLYKLLIDLYKEEEEWQKVYDIACKLKFDEEVKFTENSQRVSLLHKVVCTLISKDLSKANICWVKMAGDLYNCASKALTSCPENHLCDYLLLAKLMRIVSAISSQCESTDYQDDPKRVDGLLNQWIEDYYKEDSLVLCSTDIFPLLNKLILLAYPAILGSHDHLLEYESNRLCGKGSCVNKTVVIDEVPTVNYAILEFSKAAQALVNMLESNNQHELAIQISIFGISVCSQRTAILQLGINVLPDDDPVLIETNQLIETELKYAHSLLAKGESLIRDFSGKLVKSILSHRVLDHDLALCYLDVFTASEGQKLLVELQSKCKNKFTRIQNIAKVGVDFAALRNDQKFKEACQIHKECAFWGRKLQILRVPLSWNIFTVHSNEEEKRKILELLVALKNIDLQSIISYCKSFSFDEEEAIFMYVECCLLPSEQYISTTDTSYQEKIDECDFSLVHNLKKLENLLYGIVQKISSYDYERLTYIFKKIAEITDSEETKSCSEENVHLLEMLSMYKRTSSDITSVANSTINEEIDDEQMFDGKTISVSPEIAKTRLPFHPLAKKGVTWHILNPELTSEKNVILLKPIVNKLKFDTDQMFAKAVQMIASKELAKINNQTGNTATFDFSLVENILNMIQNHLIMMATAKWLVRNLPRGTEKARVLKAIIDRAAILVSTSTDELLEESKLTHQKFYELYKRASYEAALMEFGIVDQKYFRLCGGVAKLIIQLYEDYGDKVRFETGRLIGAPEIHALAKRIAEISETIDLERIHVYLMNKWLPCIRVSTWDEDDEDVDMSLMSSNIEGIKKENEKNLRRVIYVLASSYNQNTIRSLINAVYQESDGLNMTNVCRIRALQILFTLVDTHTIEVESNLTIEDIHEKFVSCMYLSELEQMHISHTEETFKKANKENLVKGLWRNHSHELQGIRLIADICLDYQIFDPQLWNSLLLKLLSFDMIQYLTQVLSLLSGIPQLREIPSLTKMWRAVITAPFTSVSIPLSGEEEKACLRSAQLLTRCPVILDIGLPEIASLMKKVGLYMQAMFCLKLCPDKKLRKDSIQILLDDVGVDFILSKVKKDREQGIMDPHLDAVEEEVFNYVEEHGLFLRLFGTVFFDSLVEYLIRTGKVNKLLLKIITAGKLDYATNLLSVYLLAHPECEIAHAISSEGIDASNALLMYLQKEGLLQEAKPYLASVLKSNRSEISISPTVDTSF